MNLPNRLTMLRILLIPVFIVCFYIPCEYNLIIAAGVFIIAYLTDLLDGYYARKRNLITDFGKLMDPIADKLLTASAIIFLLGRRLLPSPSGELFAFINIGREFIVSGIRLVGAAKGRVIAAGKLGKAKTFMQFITILALLLDGYVLQGETKHIVDCSLMGITDVLSLWSLIVYAMKNKDLKNKFLGMNPLDMLASQEFRELSGKERLELLNAIARELSGTPPRENIDLEYVFKALSELEFRWHGINHPDYLMAFKDAVDEGMIDAGQYNDALLYMLMYMAALTAFVELEGYNQEDDDESV